MASPRRLGTLLALVLLILVGIAAWVGWTAYHVKDSLDAAVRDADAVQSSLEAGSTREASAALADLREHSGDAADRTSGLTWRALGLLPVVGDDADGIALASDVVADLALEGAEPLISAADDLDAIVPRDGRVDLDAVERLGTPVDRADDAFTTADDRLQRADPEGYVGTLASGFRDLRQKVGDAQSAMSSAATALEVMPSMLGGDGARDFLLVMQNNAEIRATGGLPGAISVVRTHNGLVDLTRQIAATDLGTREQPLQLTKEESELFSTNIGRFPGDYNLTPDWPRAADLLRQHWTRSQPEQPAGVLSVDPVALSYLLEVTGPVTAAGVELRADNVVDELLFATYERLADPSAQDEFFRAAALAVFDRVTSGVERPQDVLRALSRAAREGRLLVHSFDDVEQGALAGTAVAGELTGDDANRPQVGAYLNDTSAAKMSYFLRHETTAEATTCEDDRQRLVGRLRLESTLREDQVGSLPDLVTGGGNYGAPVGSQLVVAYLYGPVGGSIDAVTFAGERVDAGALEHDGRPVVRVLAQLDPEETIDVEWTMTTATGQTADVDVRATPSIEPGSSFSSAASAC
ncbi:DUF4012 domain-containing protein [Nocardioides abyssi]|uniref:DUF4012 domain-containing protein n=1 Tax=Nocardioides abyssi TaxID=3058370 RepID=A0ABT8EWQ1_9ACTN|nr:DUF4012 domain-containing protein [Nocardioides abyssi]MDN4162489.1 DUF4012 domain-containing protein [Nocardioides abyssi]